MGMVSGTAAGWNGHKERKRRIQAESGQAAVCTDPLCPFLHTGWRPFDEYYNFCTRMSMFNEERIFFRGMAGCRKPHRIFSQNSRQPVLQRRRTRFLADDHRPDFGRIPCAVKRRFFRKQLASFQACKLLFSVNAELLHPPLHLLIFLRFLRTFSYNPLAKFQDCPLRGFVLHLILTADYRRFVRRIFRTEGQSKI